MRYSAMIFLLFCQLCSAEQLASRSVLGGLLRLDLPINFSRMSEYHLRIKYPGSRPPTEVYSISNGAVSIAFNYTRNAIQPSQIAEVHTLMSTSFRRRYPYARWFKSAVIEKFGTRVFVMELMTPAVDTDVHNIIYGIPLKGRLLLVSFNTTAEEAERWLDTGKRAFDTIQFPDSGARNLD
ncbi:hypothetical protein IOQ59_10910 [Pontibacterium sp. N1Y112]|uniref:Uncharacterized protein n=1 Tax=Pontibacterium sinense TaxID=2781979 RepID=A0A8J7FP32_9GAMM|nr:hypothetical protein [Pontibacterium sinense]MBE9397767.1 hypothetical protein [Pontibacterium sinense]